MTYPQQLRDPRWQQRRLRFLELKNWRCEDCSSTHKTLEIHHCAYLRGFTVWDYPDSLLRVCCSDCHELRQEHQDKIYSALGNILRNVPLQRMGEYAQKWFGEAMEDIDAQ